MPGSATASSPTIWSRPSATIDRLERETKEESETAFARTQASRQREAPQVGRVLLLYVDEAVDDVTPFGAVRHQAFAILPKEALLTAGRRLCDKPVSPAGTRWQAVDRTAARCKKHLRPLAMALDVSASTTGNPWLAALSWMKGVFSRQQRLSQPLRRNPGTPYPSGCAHICSTSSDDGNPTGLRRDRHEFWIYRQLRKRLAAGELHLDDSLSIAASVMSWVTLDRTAEALRELDIPWLRQPSTRRSIPCAPSCIGYG